MKSKKKVGYKLSVLYCSFNNDKMDRYIDMNSISTIDRMIYRRRKAKEEKRRIWVVNFFGESIDLELLLIEKEKGGGGLQKKINCKAS